MGDDWAAVGVILVRVCLLIFLFALSVSYDWIRQQTIDETTRFRRNRGKYFSQNYGKWYLGDLSLEMRERGGRRRLDLELPTLLVIVRLIPRSSICCILPCILPCIFLVFLRIITKDIRMNWRVTRKSCHNLFWRTSSRDSF